MPIKDIEVRRNYQREWARRKRAGLPTSGIRERKYPSADEKKIKKQQTAKRGRQRKKDMIVDKLGVGCFFCDKKDGHLATHRKDGSSHKELPKMKISELKEELENANEYVLLCYHCHKSVHWCMEFLGMTWSDIVGRNS